VSITNPASSPSDAENLEAAIGAYAERLFMTGLDAFEAFTIALGRQLGWYDALAAQGPSTAAEIATGTGTDTRYVREWLEQQAVAGLLEVTGDAVDADRRRFWLPEAAQECLIRPESLASVGPLFDFLASVSAVYPALVDAFRTGAGVPYADYAVHDAQGDFNRPAFLALLTTEWLPAVPGITDLLSTGAPRVAEIGCGEGWAAIAIARAWPNAHVDGFDVDEASVAAARRNAAEAGVSDRVRFEVADVADTGSFDTSATSYDVLLAFEMVHDLARPVDALRTLRHLGTKDAVYLVMDEKVQEEFDPSTENPMERFFYAASVLHCLPVGRSESPSAATGTVMRPGTLRGYATEAGFSDTQVLPIEHDLFRFYRLVTA
jgi:protein-L-isoaspartate O-methyltransferase